MEGNKTHTKRSKNNHFKVPDVYPVLLLGVVSVLFSLLLYKMLGILTSLVGENTSKTEYYTHFLLAILFSLLLILWLGCFYIAIKNANKMQFKTVFLNMKAEELKAAREMINKAIDEISHKLEVDNGTGIIKTCDVNNALLKNLKDLKHCSSFMQQNYDDIKADVIGSTEEDVRT